MQEHGSARYLDGRVWTLRAATGIALLMCGGGCSKPADIAAEASQPRILATVVSYDPSAEWDHFEDGSFSVRGRLKVQLDSISKTGNESLEISVAPGELPDDSPFRVPGTRISFRLDHPISRGIHIAWGALNDLIVVE